MFCRRLFAGTVLALTLPLAAEAGVVLPENTDEILVNPDMGLVMFHYSNRQWAYGQLQERGDTLDWFSGVSTVYFRLPWCLLEPNEGEYRWDIIDSYAAPNIPEFNDGVWVYTVANNVGNFANDKRVPTIEPGVYTLCVSLGSQDGTPRIALPLKNQIGNTKRYPVGVISVK